MELSYTEAKQIMIDALLRSASKHEAGLFVEIDYSYDTLDSELPRNDKPEFDKLFIALNFWDGWIDARNHDWKYYEGIRAEDWPRLARNIVADLDADQEITDELIRSHFDFRSRIKHPGILKNFIQTFMRKFSMKQQVPDKSSEGDEFQNFESGELENKRG
ncbi:MAG TPA: hypothetical protein VEC93_02940 [Anaerolineae bacterium]|nr:hypothetical protein [Anaerolineae bacterium]